MPLNLLKHAISSKLFMLSAIKSNNIFKMAALVSDKGVEVSGVHNRYFAVRHGQVIVRPQQFTVKHNLFLN